MFIQKLHGLQLAGRYIGELENFFSGFAKSPRVRLSSWILNECNLYFKIVNEILHSQDFVKQTCQTQKNSAWFAFQEFVFQA